jgi:MraZ protein
MFTGHFLNTLDAKGRVSVPSQFRQVLSSKNFSTLIISNHFDGCLYAYTPESWEQILNKVSKLPQSKKEVKAYQRFVISSAVECQLDKFGRILIPQKHREYAHINKEILFAGVGTRFEIWSKELWDKELEEAKEMLQDSEALAELGL